MTDADDADAVDRPSLDEAASRVESALDRGDIVTLFGRCTVVSDGRTADPADRHVMLKPDGAVLVHAADGARPVASAPPGSSIEIGLDDGRLRVSRPKGPAVAFDAVAHVAAFDAAPGGSPVAAPEADLKRRVLADPDLIEPGFRPLSTERGTSAGRVDIYGEDADGRAVAVELKAERATPDAVGQLDRYVGALERDLHAGADVRGVLVAPSLTDRARRLLDAKGLEFVALVPDTE